MYYICQTQPTQVMTSRYILYLIFLLVCFTATRASAQRNCGTMTHLQHLIEQDPTVLQRRQQLNESVQQQLQNRNQQLTSGLITIPVVVHVVYQDGVQNISMSQILSQIEVLNEDFQRLNSDADNTWPQAADIEIAFELASLDPNGNPTDGVTRTFTEETDFDSDNSNIKFNSTGGKDAWPADQYMNMWVCNLVGGLLGYAQFPGSGPGATDGVVIDYQFFGTEGTASAPFDLGRTATHEVGHWLNLIHIWGDGNCSADDQVSDTPNAGGPNYTGSPCNDNPDSCPSDSDPDMFQNYMDYSDDACMNLFTQGQKDRMRVLFENGGLRQSLIYSPALDNATCSDGIVNGDETGLDCGGSSCSSCVGCTEVTIEITLDNYPEETTWVITPQGDDIPIAVKGLHVESDGSTVTRSLCLPDGCYTFTIYDAYGDGICCDYGNGSYSVSSSSETFAAGGSFGLFESTSFCLGSTMTFEGPGTDWGTAGNWEENMVPPADFDGTIIIASDCLHTGIGPLCIEGQFVVMPGIEFIHD